MNKSRHPYFSNISRNRGPTDSEIDEAFQSAWDEFGDEKSTEFLASIVADRLSISYEDVFDALAAKHGASK